MKTIDWERINNDVSGSPRYVCHFLNVITKEKMDELHKTEGLNAITEGYKIACKIAKKLGGRKYHSKRYSGGIVFQSYCLEALEKKLLEAS